MAIRRNSSRGAAQVGELLAELRRINAARDAEGRPQIDPFADLDFDAASADAPAGVSFLSFPLRNPSRTRDTLSNGADRDALRGGAGPVMLAAPDGQSSSPSAFGTLPISPGVNLRRQNAETVIAGGDLMFPRATPKGRRRARRRRRRAAPSPSLPLANPRRRQAPDPIRDRSADLAEPSGIDVDARDLPQLAERQLSSLFLGTPKFESREDLKKAIRQELLEFGKALFSESGEDRKKEIQRILSKAIDKLSSVVADPNLRAVARNLAPFSSPGTARALRAEQGFEGARFALDADGSPLMKFNDELVSLNSRGDPSRSLQATIDSFMTVPAGGRRAMVTSPVVAALAPNKALADAEANSLIRRVLLEALGRGADFGEDFVPSAKTGDFSDSFADLLREELRHMAIRSRDGEFLAEDIGRLRALGIVPRAETFLGRHIVSDKLDQLERSQEPFMRSMLGVTVEELEPFLRQFRKKDPAGRLRGPI